MGRPNFGLRGLQGIYLVGIFGRHFRDGRKCSPGVQQETPPTSRSGRSGPWVVRPCGQNQHTEASKGSHRNKAHSRRLGKSSELLFSRATPGSRGDLGGRQGESAQSRSVSPGSGILAVFPPTCPSPPPHWLCHSPSCSSQKSKKSPSASPSPHRPPPSASSI